VFSRVLRSQQVSGGEMVSIFVNPYFTRVSRLLERYIYTKNTPIYTRLGRKEYCQY
jgi:hypothetical protein